ncbi:hypothetical protein ABE494_19210 [Stenotrophomonas lactitubi]|uniref:hypothetical protein n=1 Tax=Stenotrophomonas lactitubi TaxID=2045214 RepID=UPI003208047D
MYLKASSPEELAFARLIGASQDYEATVLRKLEECETLQPTAEKAAKWLVMAANQGSIEAQIAYATSPESTLGPRPDHESHEFQEWKRNASSYLYESMQKGSVDALSALANAYGTGLIVPRSVVKEYALQMTLERINPAYSSRKHLEELRSILTPAQIEEARKTSKSTYLTLTGNSPDL